MKEYMIMLLLVGLITLTPGVCAQGRVIGYAGICQQEITLSGSNIREITFDTPIIVHENNIQLQLKILPSPSNDLYIEESGMNDTWESYALLLNSDEQQILDIGKIQDKHPVGNITLERDQRYILRITVKVPSDLEPYDYSLKYLIIGHKAKESSSSGGTYDHSLGRSLTLSITNEVEQTISSPEPKEPKEPINAQLIALSTMIIIGIILIYIYQHKLKEERTKKPEVEIKCEEPES